MQTDTATETVALTTKKKLAVNKRPRERGVFERPKGSGVWWTRYLGSDGRIHREKAGTWANARDLYTKRKNEALEGKKLPEKLRRAAVSFAAIAKDALDYSKIHKAGTSYRIGLRIMPAFASYPPKKRLRCARPSKQSARNACLSLPSL